jgi:hypothetical protein
MRVDQVPTDSILDVVERESEGSEAWREVAEAGSCAARASEPHGMVSMDSGCGLHEAAERRCGVGLWRAVDDGPTVSRCEGRRDEDDSGFHSDSCRREGEAHQTRHISDRSGAAALHMSRCRCANYEGSRWAGIGAPVSHLGGSGQARARPAVARNLHHHHSYRSANPTPHHESTTRARPRPHEESCLCRSHGEKQRGRPRVHNRRALHAAPRTCLAPFDASARYPPLLRSAGKIIARWPSILARRHETQSQTAAGQRPRQQERASWAVCADSSSATGRIARSRMATCAGPRRRDTCSPPAAP